MQIKRKMYLVNNVSHIRNFDKLPPDRFCIYTTPSSNRIDVRHRLHNTRIRNISTERNTQNGNRSIATLCLGRFYKSILNGAYILKDKNKYCCLRATFVQYEWNFYYFVSFRYCLHTNRFEHWILLNDIHMP